MRGNKCLLPVIITLALGVIFSSGLSNIQATGGDRKAYFHLQVNGNLEIGYRKRSCTRCSSWIFFTKPCSDDSFYLRLKFANGGTWGFGGKPECGSSNWMAIHISQEGFRTGNRISYFESDRSKQSLQGATLTVLSTYYMEWSVIKQDEPEPSFVQTTTTTPAPSVSIPVVLGSAGGGGLVLVLIITTSLICYRKKRRNQEKAPDDDQECQDYDDVTNIGEEIYTDAMNTVECEYDYAECIYSDPECVYEDPGNFTVSFSQEKHQVKFQPSG